MPKLFKPVFLLCMIATLVIPTAAMAGHMTYLWSRNLQPNGHSPWASRFSEDFVFNNDSTISDIAFWGDLAVQGSYSGFRFVNIADPNNPVQVSEFNCGNAPPYSSTNSGGTNSQGDITISPDGNILVRSQDSGRILPGNDLAQACTAGTGGSTNLGFEGLQIFDVSNKAAPRFVKAVFTDFGSQHAHAVPRQGEQPPRHLREPRRHERAHRWLQRASWALTVRAALTGPPTRAASRPVTVPLDNPAGAAVANRCIVAGLAGCHDVSVYEGMKRMYGACRPNMILWDTTDPVNPRVIHDQQYPGITGWHSASMSWNGQYLYSGWEPGGGTQPRCQATVLRSAARPRPSRRNADEDDPRVARIGRRPGRPVGAPAGAVGSGELHDPQLQPVPASRPPHPDRRRVPGRELRGRLHRPEGPEADRLVGSAVLRRRSGRCGLPGHPGSGRVVDALVQRQRLRLGHLRGDQHLGRHR